MKNSDKITLTVGQLKRLIKESSIFYPEEEESNINTERRLLDRIKEEYQFGNFGTALDIIHNYLENHRAIFDSDFRYWEKRCLDECHP